MGKDDLQIQKGLKHDKGCQTLLTRTHTLIPLPRVFMTDDIPYTGPHPNVLMSCTESESESE